MVLFDFGPYHYDVCADVEDWLCEYIKSDRNGKYN